MKLHSPSLNELTLERAWLYRYTQPLQRSTSTATMLIDCNIAMGQKSLPALKHLIHGSTQLQRHLWNQVPYLDQVPPGQKEHPTSSHAHAFMPTEGGFHQPASHPP